MLIGQQRLPLRLVPQRRDELPAAFPPAADRGFSQHVAPYTRPSTTKTKWVSPQPTKPRRLHPTSRLVRVHERGRASRYLPKEKELWPPSLERLDLDVKWHSCREPEVAVRIGIAPLGCGHKTVRVEARISSAVLASGRPWVGVAGESM